MPPNNPQLSFLPLHTFNVFSSRLPAIHGVWIGSRLCLPLNVAITRARCRRATARRFDSIVKQAQANGRQLENAIRLIQETLLQNDPKFKGGDFTVELNKHFTLDGTRHEVDVYVVTRPATSYEAKVLFECKDWKKPVSKNEVIVLKEKVELLGAARGILVAREISRDAKALIAQYPRIQFRRFDDDFKSLLKIDAFHAMHDPVRLTAKVSARFPPVVFPPDLKYCLCRWNQRLNFLQSFAQERVDAIAREDQGRRFRTFDIDSVHWHTAVERLEFLPAEFFLNDIELAWLEIEATFIVTLCHKSPCFKCSIDGEGQVHTFEILNDELSSRRIELSVVTV